MLTLSRTLPRLLPLALLALGARSAAAEPLQHPGAVIYQKMCVECHGEKGEGVKGEYEEPLTGNRSLAALTKRITRTMPEDDPDLCVGEDAEQVAAYIYDAFYSPAAQARLRPPEVELVRLTVPQYRSSVADLLGRFRGGFPTVPAQERGLRGSYKAVAIEKVSPQEPSGEVKKREEAKFDRIDPQVTFFFGTESPEPSTMSAQQFSIRWEGSVIAEETGTYEFILKTENGARLWLNDLKTTFIDGWVTAGAEVREEKKSVFLLEGRAYPLRVEFFKYKDKTASIQLLWKTPHGVQEVIPIRYLSPHQVKPSTIVSTSFPADDRSVGYERGSGVSKDWQKATVNAAISVADQVEENLAELTDAKPDAPDRVERLKNFARRFVETAFRRPLTPEQTTLVDAQFAKAKTPETALRRVVLFALGSPHFLYPELTEQSAPDDYNVASRLALTLWDSLPDETLLKAAEAGKLRTRDEIAQHARRMLDDPRTKTKIRGFFHHWLDLERADSIAKDPQTFPGFDEAVLADLRTSLSMFIDAVVWSERSDYRELLQADYLLLNERLARLYGKEGGGEGFQRVGFDPRERSGVVTHPYLMAALAHNKFTSPIHRGVFLTRNVLGITLKSPPMAIEFEDSRFDPSLTMREKVTEMTRDTSCMGCHSVINPLGFALEQYDAIGRWRTVDNNKPVDPASELATDDGEVVRLTGARDIADLAVRSEQGQRAFVRHLFHHLVKQEPGAFGPDTLETLRNSFTTSEFNVRKLLGEIAINAAAHGLPSTPAVDLAQQ